MKMKDTEADKAARDTVARVHGRELLNFVQEIEAGEARKANEDDHIKAVYARAKAAGYDTKVLKAVVKTRAEAGNHEKLLDHRAMFDLYWDTLT